MEHLHGLTPRFLPTPPPLLTSHDTKPTLLVSWWCTVYAVTVILFRVAGRYVRTEKIFIEDGIMLLAIVPLLMRMGLTHVVLLFGTNNVVLDGLSEADVGRRVTGSQMVLGARVLYAAYLWTLKYSISLFLRTLTASVWRSSHQKYLRYLHIFLAVTFVGTIVGDLGACQPFPDYWRVIPAPAPSCRQGYAQLLTMGVLNIVTNVALVGFPIPMILKSRLPTKQKLSIIARLALPLLPILLTIYQLPLVISRLGSQPTRSLLASVDILLSTFVANSVVLGSLLQDRGYKKTKYKHGAASQGFGVGVSTTTGKAAAGAVSSNGGGGKAALEMGTKTRIVRNQWGSDEDLMGAAGAAEDGLGLSRPFSQMGGEGDAESGIKLETFDGPKAPAKMKFPEIRVASTWEVQVDELPVGTGLGREGRAGAVRM